MSGHPVRISYSSRPFHTLSSLPKCPCHTPLCREQLKSQPSQTLLTLWPVHCGPFWCLRVPAWHFPGITGCLVPRSHSPTLGALSGWELLSSPFLGLKLLE